MRPYVALLLLAACHAGTDPPAASTECGPHQRTIVGGCEPLGVPRDGCSPGFTSDGQGGCTAILPAAACDKRSIAVPGDTACVPIGVDECAKGFRPDDGGGCVAVLPAKPCGPGTLAVPGEESCHPVMDCGTAPFPTPPTGMPVRYVDASYAGPDADGTKDKPFPKIMSAIALASATAKSAVVVAAGTYVEDVALEGPITLVGRCPDKVTIKAASMGPAVVMNYGASLRGVAVTGAGMGLDAAGGGVIDQVWVHDTGSFGVHVEREPTSLLTITRSLFEGATDVAVTVIGARARVEASALRDSKLDKEGVRGAGVSGEAFRGKRAEITVVGSIVERSHYYGIGGFGVVATIDATLVRDTDPPVSPDSGGWGIYVGYDPDTKLASTLTVTSSLVERATDAGIAIFGATGTIRRTTVRDLDPKEPKKGSGAGIYAGTSFFSHEGSTLTVTDSLIERTRLFAIGIIASKATVERTIARDIREKPVSLISGMGFAAQTDPELGGGADVTIRRCLADATHDVGIGAFGSKVVVEESVVRGTLARASDKTGGMAIFQQATKGVEASVSVKRSILEGSTSAAVSVFSGPFSCEACLVRHTSSRTSDTAGGSGLFFTGSSTFQLTGCVVEDSRTAGLWAEGAAKGTIVDTVFRDTLAQELDGRFGDGVLVMGDASVDLARVLVAKSARAGLSALGASVTVDGSALVCSGVDLDLERYKSKQGAVSATTLSCGCPTVDAECKAESSTLDAVPPPPITPP